MDDRLSPAQYICYGGCVQRPVRRRLFGDRAGGSEDGEQAGGSGSSLRPWKDRIYRRADRCISGHGGRLHISQGCGGEDTRSGGVKVPGGVGGDSDTVCRCEAVDVLL